MLLFYIYIYIEREREREEYFCNNATKVKTVFATIKKFTEKKESCR